MNREEATNSRLQATYIALHEVAEIFDDNPGAVLIGGTVPAVIIQQDDDPHQGTVDIDIVIDPTKFNGEEEMDFNQRIERNGFLRDVKKPFRYTKNIQVGDESHAVFLELLTGGELEESPLKQIPSEDLYLSIIPGLEVAHIQPNPISIPESSTTYLNVASIPAFLAMKALALDHRSIEKKPKDAYDIVYCLRNYPGGVDAVATEYNRLLPNPILEDAIKLLNQQFNSMESIGPEAYSRGAVNEEARHLMRREAFERVNDLLDRLP